MTLGVDFAAMDRNTPIDLAAAKEAGLRFVYLKRSQHVYPDADYAKNSDAARAAGLAVGAYMFPGWGPRAASAKAQVAAFKSAPGTVQRGVDLPPTIDVEQSANWEATGWSKNQCVAALELLVREFQDQLGVTPAIYTSYNQFYSLGCPAMTFAVMCPLWLKTAYRLPARYPVDQVAPVDPHTGVTAADTKGYYRIPDPWAKTGWFIQQYQGDAVGFPGFPGTVDIDRFNTARHGDTGPHVAWLQRKLVTLPAPTQGPLLADGSFGEDLDATVRAFQAAHGLEADGVVGPHTFAAIAWT